jgi:acyl transferase domain-containing protein/NADPH:quinone reductase-like Zn-dependent oxidoreductase
MLVLERLSAAQAKGHRILATIKGSAVNQDGASNGLTAPNGPSQERVIRQALANAGLTPQEVDAVEAHGTGTTLGDPIEAGALLATYGQDREQPLYLGSVKSNIGHTQAAAGVAGVIKAVMAMREGLLPKTLHVDSPSSKVEWEEGAIELLTEAREWQPNGHPRRVGVSSFGISGTNAHLILEEAPEQEPEAEQERKPLPGPVPVVLSAKTDEALAEQASRLLTHIQERPETELTDLAYSAATTRSAFEHRAVALGADRKELLAGLEALAAGREGPGLARGVAPAAQAPVFLFPGQGGQHERMAAPLLEASPSFAAHIAECEAALAPHVEWSLGEVLREEGGAWLDRLDVVQPALFAVMVSLARLWIESGVKPAAVIGHSQGEIAAAHIAGRLSLGDAALVVARRAQAMAGIAGQGAMLSVSLSEEQLASRLEPFGERLSLAAVNGPRSLVVSGEPGAVDELQAACEADEVQTRRVAVDYAAHSAQIDALEGELLEAFEPIRPGAGDVPFHSTVQDGGTDVAELGAEYWFRNLRETVRFEPAIRAFLERGQRRFVEISPHPVLAFAVEETIEHAGKGGEASVEPSLRRDDDGLERFTLSLAAAFANGVELDWSSLFGETGARPVPLPTYPFQRRRYWLADGGGSADPSSLGLRDLRHPLLGVAIDEPGGDGLTLSGRISLASQSWLSDHRVSGRAVVPGTALLEMALCAAEQVGCTGVDELTLQAPMLVPESGALAVRVVVGATADDSGERELAIHSRAEAEEAGEWTRHAEGLLSAAPFEPGQALDPWPPPRAEPLALDALYEQLADAGLEYGESFQGLTAAWRAGEEIYAEASLPAEREGEAEAFSLHPALLDAALHAASALGGEGAAARLPFAWNGVAIGRTGARELRLKITTVAEDRLALALATGDGGSLGEVASLALRTLSSAELSGPDRAGDGLLSVRWSETALGEEEATAELWRASPSPGGDRAGAARRLCAEALAAMQAFLASEGAEGERLAIITTGALAIGDGDPSDPAQAALWGLVRAAQSEHPGAFALLDSDGSDASEAALTRALADEEEPQLALRQGTAFVPRAVPPTAPEGRLAPPPGAWRLDPGERGDLAALALRPHPEALAPLGPSEVRVAMHAAGLNFRDLMVALGLVPDQSPIGSEGAGVVVEVGSEVTDLGPGDRVMGLIPSAFAPLAIAERRLLARVPDGWSFEQAASAPVAFLTARYGLVDLAGLKRGERVLVHAGAGGVGMAAIQLAQQLGAEVFATASPAKWDTLRAAGVPEERIASSRELGFSEKFMRETDGEGVDVVLNSLAGEFVDASLELLRSGGRFLEMGKTDKRDSERVAAQHPGVSYRAFDLAEAGEERLGEMLGEVLAAFGDGDLHPLPWTAWDMREAADAFRHLREGKNVGKVVLVPPARLDPERTVLITGGSGGLGSLLARHLVTRHGARHLLLASRRGEEAEGAAELRRELVAAGAEVEQVACDVADREQVGELLASIPSSRPLGAVMHCAGALDDATIEALDGERLAGVFGPKADAAWHLHELTAGIDLSTFVVFSSAAGVLGSPGQANYAAANAFCDALARQRRAQGLPATSIAWGLWRRQGGMTSQMGEAERSPRSWGSSSSSRRSPRRTPSPSPSTWTGRACAPKRAPARCHPCSGDWSRPPAGGKRRAPRSASSLPRCPRSSGIPTSWIWCGPRPPRFSATARPPRSSRGRPSRRSASTRSPRSSCATGSAPPPACASPPPRSSTIPAPRRWRPTCSRRRRWRQPVRRRSSAGRRPARSRSRSSAWPAASRAGSSPRLTSGGWRARAMTASSSSRPTAAGTSRRCSIWM